MSTELSQIAHLFLSTVDSPSGPMTVRALLAEHLADSRSVVRQVAQHLAKELGSVGLLELHESETTLRLFTTSDAAQQSHYQRPTPGDAEHLSRALADLPASTNLLLVALDSSASTLLASPGAIQQISVVAAPESTTMVAAYRQLKQLGSSRPEVLGLTMVDCSSTAQGQQAAERLRQTVREFLGWPLRLDAIVLRNSRLREKKLAQVRSVDERILARELGALGQGDKLNGLVLTDCSTRSIVSPDARTNRR